MLVLVAPFLRPSNGIGDTPPLPYYLSVILHARTLNVLVDTLTIPILIFFNRYCLVGMAVIVLGIIYWAVWRVVLPRIFGYELVPAKTVLDDGTVVNVVRFVVHRSFDCYG